MKKAIPWIVGGLLVWLLGWSLVIFFLVERYYHISNSENGTTGYSIKFGILGTDAAGNDFLAQETTTIPLKYKDSGFRYGLVITPPNDEAYSYQCVFHFSSAPKVITGAAFDVNEPSATMRTPEVQARGEQVEYYWFDPGDPSGDQSVDIFINGKMVRTIKYKVVTEK
jgi:hypothetical protein